MAALSSGSPVRHGTSKEELKSLISQGAAPERPRLSHAPHFLLQLCPGPFRAAWEQYPRGSSTEGDPCRCRAPGEASKAWPEAAEAMGEGSAALAWLWVNAWGQGCALPRLLLHQPSLTAGQESRQLKLHLQREFRVKNKTTATPCPLFCSQF